MFKKVSKHWNRWLDEHRAQIQDIQTMTKMFKRSTLSVVGAIIIFLLIIVSFIGPYVAPFDPYSQDLKNRRGAGPFQSTLEMFRVWEDWDLSVAITPDVAGVIF